MIASAGDKQDKKILILAETEDGEIGSMTLGLLRAGRGLADKIKGELCTAVLGHNVSEPAIEIAYFSDEVYLLDNTLLATFQVDFYTNTLEQLCRKIDPDIVLMGHTIDNLDLAPRLAYRMGTQLITDCIDFDIDPESWHLLCTKPVYGDNAVAIFMCTKKPQMATLRPNIMEDMERGSTKGKVINFEPTIDKSTVQLELVESVKGESVRLDKADAIVAGGRGIHKIEGLQRLEELIEILRRYFSKVELGASRPLIDAGWLPHSRQVGLTGEKASPELYIAIGISGALQHLTGIFRSKKIVAINKDEQAPIFNYADYGIVGDYEEVVPALIEKLKELQ